MMMIRSYQRAEHDLMSSRKGRKSRKVDPRVEAQIQAETRVPIMDHQIMSLFHLRIKSCSMILDTVRNQVRIHLKSSLRTKLIRQQRMWTLHTRTPQDCSRTKIRLKLWSREQNQIVWRNHQKNYEIALRSKTTLFYNLNDDQLNL